jgi:putative membrane protein
MILAFLLGIFCGAVAGLIPGIHINLIASLVLAGSGWLLDIFSTTDLAVFIVAMGVAHALIEVVPAIFLGAPDDSTALAMLPGHRMLHDGLGYDAVRFATIGALGCLAFTLMLFPVLLWLFPLLSSTIKPVLGWLLIALVVMLVAKEKRDWRKAAIVFLATGLLGWLVLRVFTVEQPLLPLLSGLFGASSLALAIAERAEIPVQIGQFARLDRKDAVKGIVGGVLGGTLVTLFPGLGPGHAGSLATTIFKAESHAYLVLMGGLHAADFLSSLVTLVALGKARNGTLATLEKLTTLHSGDLPLLGGVALLAGGLAAGIALLSAKGFSGLVENVNYPLLSAGILLFLVGLVTLLSGWKGLLVLLASTAAGWLAPALKVSRAHAMGCLLLPTILYYLP